MNEYSYAGARNNLGFWYADNPMLESSNLDEHRRHSHGGRHGCQHGFPAGREAHDFQRQRHSYAGPATSSIDDPYLDALATFPSHPTRCSYHYSRPGNVNRFPSFTCPSYRLEGGRLTRYDISASPDLNNRDNSLLETTRHYGSAYP